eukprot:7391193-Prymnesium_polylepis.2
MVEGATECALATRIILGTAHEEVWATERKSLASCVLATRASPVPVIHRLTAPRTICKRSIARPKNTKKR